MVDPLTEMQFPESAEERRTAATGPAGSASASAGSGTARSAGSEAASVSVKVGAPEALMTWPPWVAVTTPFSCVCAVVAVPCWAGVAAAGVAERKRRTVPLLLLLLLLLLPLPLPPPHAASRDTTVITAALRMVPPSRRPRSWRATLESTPGESTALNVLRPTLRELRERPVTPGTRGLTSPLREPERADFTTADRSVRHRPPELFGGGRKPRGGEGLWHLHPLPIPAGPARRVPRAGHQPKLTSREGLWHLPTTSRRPGREGLWHLSSGPDGDRDLPASAPGELHATVGAAAGRPGDHHAPPDLQRPTGDAERGRILQIRVEPGRLTDIDRLP